MKSKLKLWEQAFVDWSHDRDVAACLADTGTGKTLMALGWLETKTPCRVLWLAPASAVDTTVGEIERHSSFRAVKAIREAIGRPVRKNPGTVYVLSYSSLGILRSVTARFDCVVADESDYLKRIQAGRTRLAIRFLKDIPKRLILTGTAITNSLMDVWSQYLFLDHGATFGRSYVAFRERYFYQAGFQWKPKSWAEAEIKARMRPTAFYCTKAVLKLPKRAHKKVPAFLHSESKKLYETYCRDMMAALPSGDMISTAFVVAKITALAKMCTGIAKDDSGKEHRIKTNKPHVLRILLEKVLGEHRKVVVWCRFRHELEDVQAIVRRLGERAVVLTSGSKPRAVVDEFQSGSTRVLVATLSKAARHFTLTAASAMIYYNRDFSVGRRLQSLDRIYRIGAERHEVIEVYDIYTKDTVEQSMLDQLEQKVSVGRKIVDTTFLQNYLIGKCHLDVR